MNKLTAIGYCLFVLGAIWFSFAVLAYSQLLQSLQPRGCVWCPPIENNGAIFGSSVLSLVFAGFGGVVLFADNENKKAAQRSRADIA